MAETNFFPRRLILGGAVISGVLLALAVHMLVARYGLDLGGLWRSDTKSFMPAGAAIAWWLIATVAFSGGYFTASLMHSAVAAGTEARLPAENLAWLYFELGEYESQAGDVAAAVERDRTPSTEIGIDLSCFEHIAQRTLRADHLQLQIAERAQVHFVVRLTRSIDASFHPGDAAQVDAIFVLQNTADPDAGSLPVFLNAHALALQITWRRDA